MIRRQRSDEANAAVQAARASHDQAQHDLAEQQRGVVASRRVVAKLKAHTAANHFDDWLMELAVKRLR